MWLFVSLLGMSLDLDDGCGSVLPPFAMWSGVVDGCYWLAMLTVEFGRYL